MVSARPRRAARPSTAVRVGRIAVPGVLLALATTGVVAAATGAAEPHAVAIPAPVQATAPTVVREQAVSRSDFREALPSPTPTKVSSSRSAKAESKADVKAKPKPKPKAKPKPKLKPPSLTVVDRKYTRVDLNVRAENDADSKLLTVLGSGSRLAVTATVRGAWRYISYRGDGGWVKNQYLVDKKPAAALAAPAAPAGISGAACSAGSAVENGLTRDAVRVHRAICARYPSVKAYGGVRADSLPEHPSGRALDAMISDSDTGWAIAKWVRANAKQLGVSEVLYAQHIWTVQRSGEGWRTFSDRGSATANHYDHVHVTVYGNSGG